MTPTLVLTKYALPPVRSRQVARARLMDSLLAGLDRKLTLISAPAGFGKSTLAAEFARSAGRPAAWLSLDRGDNDPWRWGAYLAAAVRQAGLPLDDQLQTLVQLTEQPPLETLVATLINAVATAGTPLLLVLDDYHLIHADEIHAAVALLLDRLPANFHVVIVTRTRPPLPLARLKARGDLTEITAADLRFTPAEATAFFHRAMGLDLSADGVAHLVARTEGWAAGLQLAALSLHGAADRAAAIGSFSGRSPDLLNYLVDEVIHSQTAAVQSFLLQTALLDRLTGSLCDAVTGQPGGHRTLQALEQANLFIFPLDPDRRWYRYHPLFAEFLLARLRDQVGETGVADLHRRAAHWYHEAGQFTEAVDHLLKAGAFSQAGDWLEDALADAGAGGSPSTLRRWVEQLPEPVIRQRPRLATMAAWVLISTGAVQADECFSPALAYLAMATRALKQADAAGADVRESLGVVAAVRTALASWAPLRQLPMSAKYDVARAVQCAREARQLLPEQNLFWHSAVCSSLGSVYLRAGYMSGAAQAFGEAARLGTRSGNLTAALVALDRQAQLLTVLGQPAAADEAYREALGLAAQQGGSALPTLAPIYLGMGLLRYEWNDLAGAEVRITEALKRYEAGGRAAPEALLAMARVHQVRGDDGSARTLVEQAGDLVGAGPRLRADAAAVWPDGVSVLLAQGDVAGARRWVQASGVGLDRQPDLWRATEYFALARVLVAEGQAESALPLLRTLREIAAATGCRGLEAEALVALALALSGQGDTPAARTCVQAALVLTAPAGFVRLYADGGRPILALLGQIGGELWRGRHTDAAYRSYVERLLASLAADIPAVAEAPALGGAPAALALAEPLTERERQILQRITVGASNQDVARELFMGVSTVKWHLLNIYGKLQARNRTEAVAHARALGLV